MYTCCGWDEDICMVEMELGVSGAVTRRRRRRSAEERRLIVEEARESRASVARVARKHGGNANHVFGWKRLYETGRLGAPARGITLLPVRVAEELALRSSRIVETYPAPQSPRTTALRGNLNGHGYPAVFSSDKDSVFRVVRQDTKAGQEMLSSTGTLATEHRIPLCEL